MDGAARTDARTAWTVGALLAGLAGTLSLTRIESFDYWWQLRTGRWIAENGAVPFVDVYTYTVPGAPYLDIHWLHQLGLHAIHSLAGHGGIVVAKFVLVLIVLGLVGSIGWRRERAAVSGVALGLMLALASHRFLPRPELPSFVLLAAVAWLLERDRRPGAGPWAWGVVIAQLVWTNLHGLFAVGIALVGLHLAGEIVDGLVMRHFDRRRCRRLIGVLLASLAVAFVNPNGVAGALYPLQQFGMIGPDTGGAGWVVELERIFGPTTHPVQEAIAGALFALTLAALVLNRRRLEARDALVFGAFLFLALSARRNLALFAIMVAPILVRNANAWLDTRPPARGPSRTAAALTVVLLFVATIDAARGELSRRIGWARSPGLGIAERTYPEGALAWIERERPEGPIFHHMSDGGYLLFHLFPEYRVMMDGRLEVYGQETFRRFNTAESAGFARLDEQYGFGVVLLAFRNNSYDALVANLYSSEQWKLVFVDDVSVVFVPTDTKHAALDWSDPALFPTLVGQRPDDAALTVHTRVRLLIVLQRHQEALALWEANADSHPSFAAQPWVHVSLLIRAGRLDEARARHLDAVSAGPHPPEKLRALARLAHALGDGIWAEELERQAVALDPTLERRGGRRTPRARAALAARARAERLRATGESLAAVLLAVGLVGLGARSRRAG